MECGRPQFQATVTFLRHTKLRKKKTFGIELMIHRQPRDLEKQQTQQVKILGYFVSNTIQFKT
jgi:hypothetical protein